MSSHFMGLFNLEKWDIKSIFQEKKGKLLTIRKIKTRKEK